MRKITDASGSALSCQRRSRAFGSSGIARMKVARLGLAHRICDRAPLDPVEPGATKRLGQPRAERSVGGAMEMNHGPVFPWHRRPRIGRHSTFCWAFADRRGGSVVHRRSCQHRSGGGPDLRKEPGHRRRRRWRVGRSGEADRCEVRPMGHVTWAKVHAPEEWQHTRRWRTGRRNRRLNRNWQGIRGRAGPDHRNRRELDGVPAQHGSQGLL